MATQHTNTGGGLINDLINSMSTTQHKKQDVGLVGQLAQDAVQGTIGTAKSWAPVFNPASYGPAANRPQAVQLSPQEQAGTNTIQDIALGGGPESVALTKPASVALPAIQQAGDKAALKVGNKMIDGGDQFMKYINDAPGGAQAGRIDFGAAIGKGNDLPPIPQKSSVRVTLKPSVYGADREKAVQNTVDTLVPGKTGTEKYANLQPTMDKLGTQIQGVMAANPKTATLDQIMSDYDTNLGKEGIYRTSNVPKTTVQKMARSYVTKLYANAKGMPDNIAPTEIADADLYQLKQAINQDAQSIFKKISNGTTITEPEKVILAARQSVDDTLSSLHPEVKELSKMQSHLYDAADSLFKAREKEIATVQPGPIEKLMQNPLVKIGGTALLTGVGGYGLGKLPLGDLVGGALNLGTKNDTSGATKGMVLDTSPSTHLTGDEVKKSTGLTYTSDDYLRDIQSPQYVPGSNFKNSVDTKMAATNALASQNLPHETASFMGGTAQQALNAQAQLKNVNLEGLNDVMKRFKTVQDIAAYTSSPDNPYAQDILNLKNANLQYVQAVKDVTGSAPDPKDTIQQGDTAEMIKEKLTAQNKFIKSTYKQYQPFWDARNPTNENTAPTTQGTMSPSAPAGNLPPIPQGYTL